MPEQHYLTPEKHEEFKKELNYLKTVKRTEIAKSLEYAKSLGDLSENAEYHEARDAQAAVEDRINKLEYILKNATIVSNHATDAVAVGSVIIIEKEGDKNPRTFTIVGSEEADASKGYISMRSPLGQSAVGKKKGESFSFQTPSGMMTYVVKDIK